MKLNKNELASELLKRSFRFGNFTLTSGKQSNYYFDCRTTALSQIGSHLLGRELFNMLHKGIVGIGGMTLGADPLISAVMSYSWYCGKGDILDGFIIRKKPKDHGTKQFIEGLENFENNSKVAIVDDVVTTGGSVIDSIQRCLDSNLIVKQVLCVLDRQEGGYEKIKEHGYELESIFTTEEILQTKADYRL